MKAVETHRHRLHCYAFSESKHERNEKRHSNYCFQNFVKSVRDHCGQKTTPDVHQKPRKPILQNPPRSLTSFLFDVNARQLEYFVSGLPAFEVNEALRQRGYVQDSGKPSAIIHKG